MNSNSKVCWPICLAHDHVLLKAIKREVERCSQQYVKKLKYWYKIYYNCTNHNFSVAGHSRLKSEAT